VATPVSKGSFDRRFEQLPKVPVDVCTLKGGTSSVVIPADCTFTVSIVFPWGTDVDKLTQKVLDIAERYPEAELRIDGVDQPDYADPNGELPAIIRRAADDIGIAQPALTPDIAISDCRYWRYRGIPAYWYGPGGADCSAANESVSIDDLLDTVRVHALTAYEYLTTK
jgi:acetylornithine deacetylase/succinyl-diaminopimelate desuccinylase-like protein